MVVSFFSYNWNTKQERFSLLSSFHFWSLSVSLGFAYHSLVMLMLCLICTQVSLPLDMRQKKRSLFGLSPSSFFPTMTIIAFYENFIITSTADSSLLFREVLCKKMKGSWRVTDKVNKAKGLSGEVFASLFSICNRVIHALSFFLVSILSTWICIPYYSLLKLPFVSGQWLSFLLLSVSFPSLFHFHDDCHQIRHVLHLFLVILLPVEGKEGQIKKQILLFILHKRLDGSWCSFCRERESMNTWAKRATDCEQIVFRVDHLCILW